VLVAVQQRIAADRRENAAPAERRRWTDKASDELRESVIVADIKQAGMECETKTGEGDNRGY
jgi:hypothetical protein